MSALYRWFKASEMVEPQFADGLRAGAIASIGAHGEWLEQQLSGRDWLLAEGPSVADIFLNELQGWTGEIDGLRFGGPVLEAHAARVTALPGVTLALSQEAAGEFV